jgi:ubiquinone/menaquinone biosynthesis C-methylase UbiE
MPHDHSHDPDDVATLAEVLDLDGQVLRSYWSDVMTRVHQATRDGAVRRILDLGAGTGVGTVALAERFPEAEVVAADASAELLERLAAKARERGLADRVRTVQMDLDVDWPTEAAVDLTWASMSLHHFADPDRVLARVHASTRPGGVLAVAEMDDELRFLPDELGFGQPGLEARCLDALRDEHAHSLPNLGADWSPRIAAAGFTVLEELAVAIDVRPPMPPDAARYAHRWLSRLAEGVADRLSHEDQQALTAVLDGPESVLHRDDLHIRGVRTVTLARRSAGSAETDT